MGDRVVLYERWICLLTAYKYISQQHYIYGQEYEEMEKDPPSIKYILTWPINPREVVLYLKKTMKKANSWNYLKSVGFIDYVSLLVPFPESWFVRFCNIERGSYLRDELLYLLCSLFVSNYLFITSTQRKQSWSFEMGNPWMVDHETINGRDRHKNDGKLRLVRHTPLFVPCLFIMGWTSSEFHYISSC